MLLYRQWFKCVDRYRVDRYTLAIDHPHRPTICVDSKTESQFGVMTYFVQPKTIGHELLVSYFCSSRELHQVNGTQDSWPYCSVCTVINSTRYIRCTSRAAPKGLEQLLTIINIKEQR